MRNPLRSEADAFWLLGVVGAAALAVVAVTLLTSALVGALLALVLIVWGLALAYRAALAAWRSRGP